MRLRTKKRAASSRTKSRETEEVVRRRRRGKYPGNCRGNICSDAWGTSRTAPEWPLTTDGDGQEEGCKWSGKGKRCTQVGDRSDRSVGRSLNRDIIFGFIVLPWFIRPSNDCACLPISATSVCTGFGGLRSLPQRFRDFFAIFCGRKEDSDEAESGESPIVRGR